MDEVKVLVGEVRDIGLAQSNGDIPTYPATLLSSNNEVFRDHLQSKSHDIKSTLSHIFKHFPEAASPEVANLQERITNLLAEEKAHCTELDRTRAERDQLEERLENASLRYMMAEKKLDRAKSAAVAKLERQAILGGSNEAGSGIGSGEGSGSVKKEAVENVNGALSPVEVNSAVDLQRREALALADKQKEQLEKLEAENEELTGQVTKMTVKLSNLTDDDYARSDLFKQIKSQYEDVIKRINGLEATNVQLRQEAETLQAERTAYRTQVEGEVQAPVADLESQLARAETDLARIRTTRDELGAAAAITKATQEQESTANQQIKELASAREERIKALESEVERLQIQSGNTTCGSTSRPEIHELSLEDLRARHENLEREYALLSNELPSMGAAWKKASALASKKVADISAAEEKMSRLQAEKAKADQKYFATMKLKESREGEVRSLRTQNAKSAEIIAQLKEVDRSTRALVINLERQLAETREAMRLLTSQNSALQQQITSGNITIDGLKSQLNELGNAFKERNTSLSNASKKGRQVETELDQLRVRQEASDKTIKDLTLKAAGNQSEEFEMLRVSQTSQTHTLGSMLMMDTDFGSMQCLQSSIQEHCSQALWASFLQGMH